MVLPSIATSKFGAVLCILRLGERRPNAQCSTWSTSGELNGLCRNAQAPPPSASLSAVALCSDEIITIFSDGWMRASRFMVAMPLRPGMLQSRNTTSNCVRRASVTAVSPSPASAISQLNTLSRNIFWTIWRTDEESSTISTLVGDEMRA